MLFTYSTNYNFFPTFCRFMIPLSLVCNSGTGAWSCSCLSSIQTSKSMHKWILERSVYVRYCAMCLSMTCNSTLSCLIFLFLVWSYTSRLLLMLLLCPSLDLSAHHFSFTLWNLVPEPFSLGGLPDPFQTSVMPSLENRLPTDLHVKAHHTEEVPFPIRGTKMSPQQI